MKYRFLIASTALIFTLAVSCSWHNVEEDVRKDPPVVNACDTMAVSFADTIQIIMQQRCSPAGSGGGCHLPGNGSRPPISDYNSINTLVNQGRINDRVFLATPSPMPPSGEPPLTECEKTLLERWIDAGAPNN